MDDLRAEVAKELEADGTLDEAERGRRAAAFAHDLGAQGSEAAPDARLRAILQYAERLALAPGGMGPEHVQALRDAGLDDRAIHDVAQATAYFSYINRIADGLGVDLEPEMERR